MGLMKLETTDSQDHALDKISEIVGQKTRTGGMRKFLDLVDQGKIKILIE